jgi:hypothetical protein
LIVLDASILLHTPAQKLRPLDISFELNAYKTRHGQTQAQPAVDTSKKSKCRLNALQETYDRE